MGETSKGAIELWKVLWNLNVLSVVKMFLWKALNNRLPTKKNLFCKKAMNDPRCLVCERQDETISHYFRVVQLPLMYGQKNLVLYRNGRVVRGICRS